MSRLETESVRTPSNKEFQSDTSHLNGSSAKVNHLSLVMQGAVSTNFAGISMTSGRYGDPGLALIRLNEGSMMVELSFCALRRKGNWSHFRKVWLVLIWHLSRVFASFRGCRMWQKQSKSDRYPNNTPWIALAPQKPWSSSKTWASSFELDDSRRTRLRIVSQPLKLVH